MLSLATGHTVEYLTGPVGVASGAEGYYTGAVATGEPAGQWHGAGAAELGLSGDVDATVMEAVYSHQIDPRDPASRSRDTWDEAPRFAAPDRAFRDAGRVYADLLDQHPEADAERREELWKTAQSSARQAVSFIDATFSVQKSITVMGVAFERAAVEAENAGRVEEAAAWREHHRVVEESAMVGARAAVDYLEDTAGYGRVGTHGGGGGRWVDSHRWVVAMFRQHDSRDKDPQLHVHAAIANRQLCADGTWRTLDSKAIHQQRAAAAAVAERATEEYLATTLGVRFATRPDGKAREVVGIGDEVLELFSSRRRAIGPAVREMVDAFTERYGREPSPAERYTISQDATLRTRAGKASEGEDLDARLERWEQQTRAQVAGGLARVAAGVVGLRQDAGPPAAFSPDDVVARALDRVAVGNATWTRSDLMRAVSDCLPGHLGLSPDEVRPLLDQLTDQALDGAVRISPEVDLSDRPAEFLLAGGGDVFARQGAARYSAPGQLSAELALAAAAVERGAMAVPEATADTMLSRYAEHGVGLGADQAAALRGVLSSGARLEVLAAPAGTGKTVVVGALAQAWGDHGRRVVGLAPSQVAADVMTDEGVDAVNIDRWLLRPNAGLQDGDIVVVDEAGMASTQQVLAVHHRCEQAGAKLLLVGDPEQLGAVGPGGALSDMTEHAQTYELAEVRRFTQAWEREASLQLRAGDPAALDAYERAGRIRSSGTGDQAEADAVRAWLADTIDGKQSLLLAGSNEAAERMSGAARAELVRLGHVPEHGVRLGRDGNIAGAGDLVQARRNGWHVAGVPVNRATYRVQETREDGSMVVAPMLGEDVGSPVHLPADYVTEHLSLGYASTVHAGQGRTVDTTHSVINQGWSRSLAYVGLTRGREQNTAWCTTVATAPDSPPGEAQEVRERTGRAVLSDILERDSQERSARTEQAVQEAEQNSELTIVGQLLVGIQQSTAGQTGRLLDGLAARGVISEQQRRDLAADEAMSAVERLLRTTELDGHSREQVLTEALQGRSLVGAVSPGRVLHHRLHRDLQPAGVLESFRDVIPPNVLDYHQAWLEHRADDADHRRREIGAELAADPPVWALDALGAVPKDPVPRAEWEAKAGWGGAYREMAGHDDEQDALGVAPPAGLAEKLAVWRTAHHALGLTERSVEEGALSDGALRSRVAAYEREKTWAPEPVRGQLAATAQAADERRVDATLYEAHGDATAVDAAAEVLVLEETGWELDEADRAREAWHEHTAETRGRAERAKAELQARDVDIEREPAVTAQEWLAEHEAAVADEDRHRPVDRLAEDDHDLDDTAVGENALETAVPDVRDTSQAPEPTIERVVPSWQRAREAVARAQESMAEIHQRDAVDEPIDIACSDQHEDDDADVAVMD